MTVWVDSNGVPLDIPSSDTVLASAIRKGLAVVLGSWLALAMLVLGIRRLLDRSRMRAWQTEWAKTG